MIFQFQKPIITGIIIKVDKYLREGREFFSSSLGCKWWANILLIWQFLNEPVEVSHQHVQQGPGTSKCPKERDFFLKLEGRLALPFETLLSCWFGQCISIRLFLAPPCHHSLYIYSLKPIAVSIPEIYVRFSDHSALLILPQLVIRYHVVFIEIWLGELFIAVKTVYI